VDGEAGPLSDGPLGLGVVERALESRRIPLGLLAAQEIGAIIRPIEMGGVLAVGDVVGGCPTEAIDDLLMRRVVVEVITIQSVRGYFWPAAARPLLWTRSRIAPSEAGALAPVSSRSLGSC
jgi:hypothetical protein